MARLSSLERRDRIIDAALAVARRKGLATTTVRDVATEMGTSSGLIHHYFDSMDDVLAEVFERVAAHDLELSRAEMATTPDPVAALATFIRTYAPIDRDWSFQLWLDAWAEAARRPRLQAASRRLNLAWVALLEDAIRAGLASGQFRSLDPTGAAWRILAVLDGLALQVVAHPTVVARGDVERWGAAVAERELGLDPGLLAG
ncbi:MAG: TetR family transcriptional regulator C-terminal domain-containing protein [Chloroflexi bacterium]|nr:TetR family transcriptional regulator C-terminal domain-containing protein [Chloroflexota bacterium]